MSEYKHEWNKCSECGYMELKTITIARVLSVLAPEKLVEPFLDPLSPQTTQEVPSMDREGERVHQEDDPADDRDSPSNN